VTLNGSTVAGFSVAMGLAYKMAVDDVPTLFPQVLHMLRKPVETPAAMICFKHRAG
jgi:hypothetical protein